MSGPDSSNGKSIRHEFEGWGFESPSGRDIFCLKKVGSFTRTPVRVTKMNVVSRAQLIFQMLTLFKNIYTTRASVQKHGIANAWWLKWLEHSAWIRRLGVWVRWGSRHFLSQNFDTFTTTSVRVSKMNVVARAQLTFQMLTLLKNISWLGLTYPLIRCRKHINGPVQHPSVSTD